MVKRLFMLLFLLGCLTGCSINSLSDYEFDAQSDDKIIEGRVIEIKKITSSFQLMRVLIGVQEKYMFLPKKLKQKKI